VRTAAVDPVIRAAIAGIEPIRTGPAEHHVMRPSTGGNAVVSDLALTCDDHVTSTVCQDHAVAGTCADHVRSVRAAKRVVAGGAGDCASNRAEHRGSPP
jgi:hypothetical protein